VATVFVELPLDRPEPFAECTAIDPARHCLRDARDLGSDLLAVRAAAAGQKRQRKHGN